MKLIDLKCPNCHSSLKVNEELDIITCNYCGSTIKIEDENDSPFGKILKTISFLSDKSRKYHSSEEYKKRLAIKNEEYKKSMKNVLMLCAVSILGIVLISFISSRQGEITCYLNDKEYYFYITKDNLSCAACTDEMLKLLTDKYYVNNNVSVSETNIENYFYNEGGTCGRRVTTQKSENEG